MAAQSSQQSRQFNNGYNLPNGTPNSGLQPASAAAPPSLQGRVVQAGGARVLCVADVRGNLKSLNDLARSARADYIIHTGDFGFYDERSLDRIAEKTLRHVIQYSPLIGEDLRRQVIHTPPSQSIKDRIPRNVLSQLPLFLSKQLVLEVPVYTVWGACEDVQVLEKLRSGDYKVDNLHIIDESHSNLIEVGGLKLRLLGLGGAVVMHKLFDNGEGKTTIAGGQGTMWTTLLQMGELVETANRSYDPTETRILVTHASPAREGLLNQLCVSLKVDFSISAGLHFRYGSSYNEFSVNPTLDHYRGKLAASRASFNDVWETVRSEVEPAVEENEIQKKLLHNALDIVNRMPSVASGGNPFGGHMSPSGGVIDEAAFKNMWNFNLADAAFGWLVLEIENGRIGTEMKAQGFNFLHRGMKNPSLQADMIRPSGPSPGFPPQAAVNVPGSTSLSGSQAPPPVTAGGPPSASATPSNQPRQPGPPSAAPQSYSGPQQHRSSQPPRPQPGQQQGLSASTADAAPQTVQATPHTQSLPSTHSQQSQQSQQPPTSKPATSAASTARSAPSPSPQVSAQTSKPPSQQPSAPAASVAAAPPTTAAPSTNGVPKEDTSKEGKPIGDAPTANSESVPSKDTSVPLERKVTDGIFVSNVSNEDEARNVFDEGDRGKIQRIEKRGTAFIAHFASVEEATAILDAAPRDLKGARMIGKPNIKPAYDRPPTRYDGTGGWGSQARGGAQQGAYRPSNNPQADGEAGRGGRGSFRSRGARGSERGRGNRGARGSFKGEGGASAAPASPAPAVAGGSS